MMDGPIVRASVMAFDELAAMGVAERELAAALRREKEKSRRKFLPKGALKLERKFPRLPSHHP